MNRSPVQLVSWWLTIVVLGVLASLVTSTFGAPVAGAQTTTAPVPPVRGTAAVKIARAVHALQHGDTLRAEDFTLVDTVIAWHWTSVSPDTTLPRVGWIARRPIAAGEVLHTPAVNPPPVITAGSTVRVLYQDGSVHLVLTGVAVSNAAMGAPVGVRIDKNRRLDGFAVGPNTVRLR
jgi:flagella basal body P-ring formation protein FlgA